MNENYTFFGVNTAIQFVLDLQHIFQHYASLLSFLKISASNIQENAALNYKVRLLIHNGYLSCLAELRGVNLY